jgi:hypothetical protein
MFFPHPFHEKEAYFGLENQVKVFFAKRVESFVGENP